MSYLNLIQIEAATANVSMSAAALTRPRLLWAELTVFGFAGQAGLAVAAFGSLAWMFVCC